MTYATASVHKLESALVASSDTVLLNSLRFLSIECRASARLDPFHACDILATDPSAAQDAIARSLVRVLGQSIAGKFWFRTPGCAETSFDEDWLLRAVERTRVGDLESLAFLLHRRVARPYHRVMRALLIGIAGT